MPSIHTLVLDDYGAERGVSAAVADAVDRGLVRIQRFIGEAPPWSFAGRVVDEWEGVVLEPLLHTGDRSVGMLEQRSLGSLLNTTWVIFPSGVFVSGYFQPHGKIFFDSDGVASSSYGSIAWRRALEYDGLESTLEISALAPAVLHHQTASFLPLHLAAPPSCLINRAP
mmetsp:Transcript_50665/g.117640  ORF Transcript_50665/g.117640 Transcript_50665/m.117640 type:complete len:169 (+) Transcript_50665:604-1110(+)